MACFHPLNTHTASLRGAASAGWGKQDWARAHARARARAHARARARAHVPDRVRIHVHAHALARTHERVLDRVRGLDRELVDDTTAYPSFSFTHNGNIFRIGRLNICFIVHVLRDKYGTNVLWLVGVCKGEVGAGNRSRLCY